MNSVSPKQPALHLRRSVRNSEFGTPVGKIALYICAVCPELRPFKGVILQYLVHLSISVSSEGLQAIKRYKAYKAMFLEVVASNSLPRRKYKHAMPIYRLALMFRGDSFILSCLHTVFRSYDLYTPPQSIMDSALEEFSRSFLVDSPDLQQHNSYVVLQDGVFNFDDEVVDLIDNSDFKAFASKVKFNRFYEPEEKAIMLSKKGTSRFREQSSSRNVKGFAPSIVGSTAELTASNLVSLDGGDTYYDVITHLGNLIGERSMPSMRMDQQDPPDGNLVSKLRRNVVLGAPGYKTRIIAIADYNVNYALSPLHKWAFDVLSMIDSDYTFDHSKGFQKLQEFTRESPYVACFDLSNATDALPVKLGESIIRFVAPNGAKIAPLWTQLMTALPFDGKWYRIGQPMGMLSSWAIGLALTHHFIVWIAAKMGGERLLRRVLSRPSNFYGMVGDDLFIVDAALAHYYSIVMSILGVKINPSKSLFVNNDRRVSEFVKRNSFNGSEITAISPNVVVKSFTDYSSLVDLINKTFELSKLDSSQYSTFTRKTVDLYRTFGDGFVRHAISTMCAVPTIYAGLLNSEERASVPPPVRLLYLTQVSLKTIEFSVRSAFISSTGKDVYNELTMWLLEDITSEASFPRTQFYEYLKKMNQQAESLFGPANGKSNIILGLLADMSLIIINDMYNEHDFRIFEDHVLDLLKQFTPPGVLSYKEASRLLTRSTAFKVYKSHKRYREDPNGSVDLFKKKISSFYEKYSFKLPTSSLRSREDAYISLFGEIED